MDEALLAEILERLDADEAIDDDASYLVFAACAGDAELAGWIDTTERLLAAPSRQRLPGTVP